MSKTFRSFLFVFAVGAVILQLFNNSNAQDVLVWARISADSPMTATFGGLYLNGESKKTLSFLFEYGEISGLGERISDVRVFDDNNNPINVRRMIAGEYLAEREFTRWTYNVDLTPNRKPSAAAHVSWLGARGGILMLDDLLPQLGGQTPIDIGLNVLRDWAIATTEKPDSPDTIFVQDIEKAVFYVGGDFRRKQFISNKSSIELNLSGEWLFTDDEAADIAASIFGEYEQIFGSSPAKEFMIGIRKFPQPVSTGNWEADTRGRTVTIISSDMPFRSQSLQLLHEQLRHEIFHLWIPNGVNLTGNYDWFYEGFALYQSLKIGVGVNRIRFDDFLDTLSRAYDIDRLQSQKFSLIDASKNRWNGANTQVYARGMLVAFLCDLAMLDKSKGKRSVADLLKEIYAKHRPPAPAADGNAAVLSLLRGHSELTPIIDRNITGAETIDWTALLISAGLEAGSRDRLTQLKVTAKPTGRQKEILDKLGYNNWRKPVAK